MYRFCSFLVSYNMFETIPIQESDSAVGFIVFPAVQLCLLK